MRRLLALGLVTVFALGACGGGDDDAKTATVAGSSNTTADDGSGSTGTGNEEIDALLEKQASAVIRVTYEDQNGSTFVISQDGDNRAVIQDGGEKFLELDGKVYTCTTGDSAQCMELPSAAAGLGSMVTGMFGLFSVVALPGMDNNPLFDVTTSEGREIAGRSATCTTLEAGPREASDTSITACLDDETGVFLLGEASDGGDGSRIEATDVSEPQDSDFELTGDVVTVPSS